MGEEEEEESGSDEEEEAEDAMDADADEGEEEEEEEEEEEAEEGEEAGSGKKGKAGALGAPEKKAAAALAVSVGSFSDPPEAQGLSHFLEHMVFMGSERFPDENSYDAYLQQHGGGSNAYTEAEQTVFHFDVTPAALRGALERFAAQFEAPLCAEGATAREVRAVDSEFTQAAQSDGARLLQVQCAAAPAGHPAALFSWGNARSLVDDVAARGGALRPLLLAHAAAHYRAPRMTLCVLGAEPLDTLEAWVRELFGRVPSGGAPKPCFAAHGSMMATSTGALFRTPSVKEAHELTLTFALPPLGASYDAKPDEYASHLLGHEGAGSLLSALKARGWAAGLCAGVAEGGHERSTAAWLFTVGVTLTDAGVAAWRDVAALVFQYCSLLRASGPQQWIFAELAAIKNMEFRFAEEEDASEYVTRLAAGAERYAPQHAVAGEWLLTRWDAPAVAAVLAALTPRNCRLDLQSSAFALAPAGDDDAAVAAAQQAQQALLAAPVDGEPGAGAHRESWFDVPYGRAPLPAALLEQWERAAPAEDLRLPPRNAYLATDFALRARDGRIVPDGGGAPKAPPPAHDDDDAYPLVDGGPLRAPAPPAPLPSPTGGRVRAWHKLDGAGGRFGAPRGAAFWAVTVSDVAPACGGPCGEALTHLALKLAEDALAETSYLADVAGLRCHVTPDGARFELKVEGFSHKLPVLAAELFAGLAALPTHAADAGRLCRVRESLLRRLRNALVKPTKHAAYLRLRALRHRAQPLAAQLAAVEGATCAALSAHAAALLAHCAVDALVMGNVTAHEAAQLSADAAAALPPGAGVPPEAWPRERVLRVPPGGALLFATARNAADDNSVAEVYFQIGTHALPSTHERACADLGSQLIGEPCFDALRTKEQLGYTVSSGVRLTHGVLGFAVTVQSAKHGPAYLDARIDAFLAAYQQARALTRGQALNDTRQTCMRSDAPAAAPPWRHSLARAGAARHTWRRVRAQPRGGHLLQAAEGALVVRRGGAALGRAVAPPRRLGAPRARGGGAGAHLTGRHVRLVRRAPGAGGGAAAAQAGRARRGGVARRGGARRRRGGRRRHGRAAGGGGGGRGGAARRVGLL
jgi:nardilysin